MAQKIDVKYRGYATSEGFNAKLKDITGPCVIRGFKLEPGSTDYKVSLMKSGADSSVAVMFDGTRIEETADLMDVVTVDPNTDSGAHRIDHIYLVFDNAMGSNDQATYAVVNGVIAEGVATPPTNPDARTHLYLGYVEVPPNSGVLGVADLHATAPGFSKLEVAGSAQFHGDTNFDGDVIVKGSDISSLPQTVSDHTSDTSNPHGVTTTQIGAATESALTTHTVDNTIHFQKSDVTKTDVELDNVDNVQQATKTEFDAHKGEFNSFTNTTESNFNFQESLIDEDYNYSVQGTDEEDKIIEIHYTRSDATLFRKVEASNPNADGNYQTLTMTEYEADGTTVKETREKQLTYVGERVVERTKWTVVV